MLAKKSLQSLPLDFAEPPDRDVPRSKVVRCKEILLAPYQPLRMADIKACRFVEAERGSLRKRRNHEVTYASVLNFSGSVADGRSAELNAIIVALVDRGLEDQYWSCCRTRKTWFLPQRPSAPQYVARLRHVFDTKKRPPHEEWLSQPLAGYHSAAG